MPIFQASISTAYDSNQESILMQDKSDYAGNTQIDTHALSDFGVNSYYRIEVEKPDGSTFVWSNKEGDDVFIPSASLSIFDCPLKLNPEDASGDYIGRITVVPEWGATAIGYSSTDNDIVYHNDLFWIAVGVGIFSEPSVGNPEWDIVSRSALDSKYVVEATIPVTKAIIGEGRYSATFVDSDGDLGLSVDSNCGSIQITDNSNYINGEAGHDQSDFSEYRVIKMTKPNGSLYYFSSIDFEDINEDQVILPASSGGTEFFYMIDEELDKDGVYEFTICNYPTWNEASDYLNEELTVVFYNGELYKALLPSQGVIPENDITGAWELYELTNPEDEYTTRYCTCAKMAVLCIDTYDCLEKMTHDAYCLIDTDYCNDDLLCGNKRLLDLIKLKVVLDSIDNAVNRQAWEEVKVMFNHVYNICGCC